MIVIRPREADGRNLGSLVMTVLERDIMDESHPDAPQAGHVVIVVIKREIEKMTDGMEVVEKAETLIIAKKRDHYESLTIAERHLNENALVVTEIRIVVVDHVNTNETSRPMAWIEEQDQQISEKVQREGIPHCRISEGGYYDRSSYAR
jgi:hypothetical protein